MFSWQVQLELSIISATRAEFIIPLHLPRLIACLQLKGFNKQTAIGVKSEKWEAFLGIWTIDHLSKTCRNSVRQNKNTAHCDTKQCNKRLK